MQNLCNNGFTAKALSAAHNNLIYEHGNYLSKSTDLGDETRYFDTIVNKPTCKIKVCSQVKSADNTVDATNAASFTIVKTNNKYKWTIVKFDIEAGLAYPQYKMKCEIDVNKDGANP